MGGWAPGVPVVDPSVKIPEGMQVAGMGRRIGAWILDGFISSLLGIVPVVVAIATRAVSLNQQALDQMRRSHDDPFTDYYDNAFADVTAPLLDIQMGSLAVIGLAYLLIMAVYFVWPWMAWGASPAQKMLGLRVVDSQSGANLRIDQALIRWAVLTGVGQALMLITLLMMLDWMASTPGNQWLYYSRYGTTTAEFGPGGGFMLLQYVPTLWQILLVIVTGVDKMKRGWHDKLAGSIVVGPIQYSPYAAYPGYGGAPAWPPQPAGSQPQYPAWPPQAPGAPPQYPGYPPSAYPGYPGYPGYPPQGQPPVAPTPPAAPAPPPAEAPADKPKS